MTLSHQQSRRRRIVLVASGILSVGLLAAAIVVPSWHADAGGLERGERPLAPSRTDRRPRAKAEPFAPTNMPAPKAKPVDPHEQARQPAKPDVPIAVPAPLPPPSLGRVPDFPPFPQGSPPRLPTLPPPITPPIAKLPAAPDEDLAGVPLAALKSLFRRPRNDPATTGNDAEQIALGARLFAEPKLSADHKMSCASCHSPGLSFVDQRRKARGNKGQDLSRNTPSLWNLSPARSFYWDGRAASLEAQIKDAIERDGEMDATVEAGVLWLSRDPSYVQAFQRAFGGNNPLSPENLIKALALYERNLISPETRFDRWIEGDTFAFSERELAGFRLFTGKGRCLACHGGWRMTDDGFHDIGLRSKDPGRQTEGNNASRAFKTPSLREALWSKPYMHDGSLATFEDVIAHYAGRLERRDSLAPELKQGIALNEAERSDLVAFLKTLSSGSMPVPAVPIRPVPTRTLP